MRFDTEKIRSELSMQVLLEKYGINNLHQHGNSLSGCCPIHHGDNPNAFHVSLEKNLWNCFTRHHGGDVLSFIMEYENVGFQEACRIATGISSSPNVKEYKPAIPIITQETKTNPTLNFTLDLDPTHPYLRERGLNKNTIEHFGIGYCNSGIMRGRIAIPIHDENGNLVAYSGRSLNREKPKYKLPKGFNKMEVVFNLHRVKTLNAETLILVEGYFSVFRIHQAGFPNVVALMGSFISERQIELIQSLAKKLIVLLDGDPAGRIGTKKIIEAFKGKNDLTAITLPEGQQPDSMDESEIQSLLNERD